MHRILVHTESNWWVEQLQFLKNEEIPGERVDLIVLPCVMGRVRAKLTTCGILASDFEPPGFLGSSFQMSDVPGYPYMLAGGIICESVAKAICLGFGADYMGVL